MEFITDHYAVMSKEDQDIIEVFGDDGSFGTEADGKYEAIGTYNIDGDRLTIDSSDDGGKYDITFFIESLTSDRMIGFLEGLYDMVDGKRHDYSMTWEYERVE